MYKVVLLLKDTHTGKHKEATKSFHPSHREPEDYCEVLKVMFEKYHYACCIQRYAMFYPELDGDMPLHNDADRFKLLRFDVFKDEELISSFNYK